MYARLVVVMALGACNQVFGLDPTNVRPAIDAQQFDAPIDAPYACPPIGQPPMFSVKVHQVVAGGSCAGYSRSSAADLAIANCPEVAGPLTNPIIEQGPIDSQVTVTNLIPTGVFDVTYAALGPDGDQLWVTRAGQGPPTISVYDRTPPNSWTSAYDAFTLPLTDSGAGVSPPMRAGPDRHILYTTDIIHELAEMSPGVWNEVHNYGKSGFGVGTITDAASLSPDGLRMVFNGITEGPGAGIQGVFYADRASVTVAFNTAALLDGPPADALTPFLTEDCGRLYFSGLGSVFFVAQP